MKAQPTLKMMSESTVSRWINPLLLVLAAAGVLAYTAIAAAKNAVGFPLDDSWIHQTYARNLALHGEWAFVTGEPSAASTSPLYSFLLSFGHLFGLAPFVWTHLLGILALFGAGYFSRPLAERLFPNVPWVGIGTSLMMVTTWHFVWAASSGMETMLFMTLSLAFMWAVWRELDSDMESPVWRRGVQVGVVGGLLTLTRPEGVGLVGLAGLLMLVSRVHSTRRIYLHWAVGVIAGFVLVVTPYLVINYIQSDQLLPTTIDAKIAENAPLREQFIGRRYLRLVFSIIAGAQLVWLPGIIWGIASTKRHWLLSLPLVWAFAHLSIFAWRLPVGYQHGRYIMPILPPVLLYAVGGMLLAVIHFKHTPLQRVVVRTLALSAVFSVGGFWWIGGQAYGDDVRLINTEMVKTAKWVSQNVPPDELLAVHDIGAVGYYAPRSVFDLAGLVSPEIVPIIREPEALMQMMCEQGAQWLMVLPEQQPALDDDPRLELVYSTNEPYIIEEGGEGNMKVFRLHFSPDCH
ncbi:MAG: hypothetical protein H6673_13880 [Anaerolineales bacterium]|nr:hypothetical protein [Anaerolineales bacterium]